MCIQGITWDHPRGYNPLVEGAKAFSTKHSNVKIVWKKRTLEEFGDYPINILAREYDLIMTDHPFMGEADYSKLFIPLDEYISNSELQYRQDQSIGMSAKSYMYNTHTYALACDAAAQVSVYNPQKITKEELPTNWSELKTFAKNHIIAVPLCAVDLWCVFLTLCVQIQEEGFFCNGKINKETGIQAIDLIYELLNMSSKQSIISNPISILDAMSIDQEIVYSPILFGYTNYSRKSCKHPLVFTNVFSINDTPKSVLGGVGIAVSSYSKNKEMSIEFAKFITDPEFQRNEYYKYDGQPAYKTAWNDREINEDCNDFFLNTIDTLCNAYVRPQYPQFNVFQETISKFFHESILEKKAAKSIVDEMIIKFNDIVKIKRT